jgi:hypothetical protein
MQTSRRTLLQAGLAAPLATSLGAAAASAGGDMFSAKTLMADVRSYAEAGNKQSGGAGDRWAADWMAERLAAAGFSVERQQFEAPWFQAEKSELAIGDQTLALVAQPLVVETSAAGLNAPLRLAESAGRLDGAIAVIRLPYRRWSTITDRAAREPLADAKQRGASAAILVTTGPTGDALLLNAPADTPAFAAPLGLLAPMKAAAVIEAARNGQMATLTLFGKGGVRVCENIIGRIDRGTGRWLVSAGRVLQSGWHLLRGCLLRSKSIICFLSVTVGMSLRILAQATLSPTLLRHRPKPTSGSIWVPTPQRETGMKLPDDCYPCQAPIPIGS